MSIFGDYLDQSGERIPCQYTPELSRRARAIDLWAVLRTLGKVGVDELVSRTCQYAEHVAKTLDSAGFEVLNKIETNQVLVSFGRDPETTHRVIRGFQTQGICWCGGTVWKGKTAMRISVSSFKTTADDIERSLQAILTVARQIAGTVLTTREGEIDQP
jgi:glutamate/tyrosine decarboxylase-like PLP-dependent enzyme